MTTENGSPLGDLICRASTDGRVDLFDLTDDEEAVVGRGEWVMTRADLHQAWLRHAEDERRPRTALAGQR